METVYGSFVVVSASSMYVMIIVRTDITHAQTIDTIQGEMTTQTYLYRFLRADAIDYKEINQQVSNQ